MFSFFSNTDFDVYSYGVSLGDDDKKVDGEDEDEEEEEIDKDQSEMYNCKCLMHVL